MSRNFELLAQIEEEFEDAPAENEIRRERISPRNISRPYAPRIDGDLINLVQRVFFPRVGNPSRRVVFCGIEQSHGSGSVCERAGRTLASQTSEKVCLIDANPAACGFSHLLTVSADEEVTAGKFDQVHHLQVGSNLWFTQLHPGAVSGTQDFRAAWGSLLEQVQREFGFVLIDAPACVISSQAMLLGQLSDALILVVEADETRRATAARVKEGLQKTGVRLAGTVLNNRSFPIPKALYKWL